MPSITDPARELIDTLEALGKIVSGDRGDNVMAAAFRVEPWSRDFLSILACIADRIAVVKGIISQIDTDEDIRERLIKQLDVLQELLGPFTLFAPWNNSGVGRNLIEQNVGHLLGLPSEVRRVAKTPRLSAEEVESLIENIADLKSFLYAHQLADRDFIRQTIIDGLEQMEFRLTRLGWFGWGYTEASLRIVLAAYMALERDMPDFDGRPDLEAVSKKTWAFLKRTYELVGVAKDAAERGSFVAGALAGGPIFEFGKAGMKAITNAS